MHAQHLLVETFAHMPPLHALEQLPTADAERVVAGINHSIADIVAHMSFWQAWFCDRCEGRAVPMVAAAADGWPQVAPGSWPEVQARFAAGLERALALDARREEPITPAIEFPPLAGYTVGDALVHMAQHNSHHLGQVILLRQLLGHWPPPAGSFTW